MEKAFVLKTGIPELATNGKVAVYSTIDPNVNHIVILKSFEWVDRKKTEVFRCPRCRCYIYPDKDSKIKEGIPYHKLCTVVRKLPEKEAPKIEETV